MYKDMKKTYIIPETLIVNIKVQSALLQASLPKSETEITSEEILVKYNWGSFWDEWAGAAGE